MIQLNFLCRMYVEQSKESVRCFVMFYRVGIGLWLSLTLPTDFYDYFVGM